MSRIIIVRGLPGSGKSTLARQISEKNGAILIEPDALCIQDGKYKFNHAIWRNRVELAQSLVFEVANRAEADIIYADVLPTKQDVQEVIDKTKCSLVNYSVQVFTLDVTKEESIQRNLHNVRVEDIERMIATWEEW